MEKTIATVASRTAQQIIIQCFSVVHLVFLNSHPQMLTMLWIMIKGITMRKIALGFERFSFQNEYVCFLWVS